MAYTDTTLATGTGGTMYIRDHGSTIEFHLTQSNNITYVGSSTWSGTVNGVSVGGSWSWPAGQDGALIASYTVTTSQTVTFAIAATGTSGFGGPTSHSRAISRSAAPAVPTALAFSLIDHVSAKATWTRGSMNGGTFANDQIQVSSKSQTGTGDFTGTPIEITASPTTAYYTMTGLLPGVKYYVHVRTKNSVGYGPWTAVATFTTLAGTKVKVAGVWKDAIPYVKVAGVWKTAVPYVKVAGTWKPTA